MQALSVVLLLPLLLLGHGFLWVALINRSHSVLMPHALCSFLTKLMFALGGLIPLGFMAGFLQAGMNPFSAHAWQQLPWPALGYAALCVLLGILALALWVKRWVLGGPSSVLRCERVERLKVLARDRTSPAFNRSAGRVVRLPGNESHTIDIAERALELPRLHPALDGLSIVHLSDLHFTGLVDKAYFQEVIRLTNAMEPDLVAITGDIIDDSAYIDWIPDTLGQLAARHGVYFILGNHDLRHDFGRLRRTMTDCGLADLGGRWREVEIRGRRVLVAGNELPWFPPAADLSGAPVPASSGGPLRILLAHSPDQFPWALTHDIDLMLAGHNHGGQIRLPLLGPVFSPSRYGVRYASGVFHASSTVLHVSRGVSAKLPLRWNCAPELVRLTLHPSGQSAIAERDRTRSATAAKAFAVVRSLIGSNAAQS